MPRKRRSSDDNDVKPNVASASTRRRTAEKIDFEEEVNSEMEEEGENFTSTQDFGFSQQAPEASQGVFPEKAAERRNLDQMDQASRDKVRVLVVRIHPLSVSFLVD
jgi:hypothetical protein